MGTAAAVTRGRFNGAGGTGRSLQKKQTPGVLEVYNFDKGGLTGAE